MLHRGKHKDTKKQKKTYKRGHVPPKITYAAARVSGGQVVKGFGFFAGSLLCSPSSPCLSCPIFKEKEKRQMVKSFAGKMV
jgi:hypothetical protein